ncbi:hypothetical protein GCM10007063_26690 [Lentibacillus kapialis]|uniref:Uncharacterized protein n=1 Tax=Lentibacillus kapialis TaxID=340214 RepID=A0A917Q087_9BACI|nr:hypothetical protein [Lentibacillus kapialis]GGK03144.1 hypothetical protein GCM10007063_26690 [Lentibacillus kapialis]
MKKVISWSILSSIIIALVVWVASIIFTFSYNEWSVNVNDNMYSFDCLRMYSFVHGT